MGNLFTYYWYSRNKNLIKYILVELENYLSGNKYQFEDATSSIEHILPENPSSDWYIEFPSDIIDDCIYSLGNYTLLEEGGWKIERVAP